MKIKRGSTSVRRLIFIADSSSTTGAGLANLAHNTSGLVAYYYAGDLANEVQITLASATLGTYASGGFVAVDNTNMPGWYELGIPDAAMDGGNEVAIQLRGAANMVPVNIYIELDAVDYQSATNFGLSKFADIETDTQDIQARLPAALVSGRMDASVGAMATNTLTAAALAADAGVEVAQAVRSELATELGRIDATISSRASQTSVDGKPTLAQIEASTVLAKEATVATRASQTSVDDIPTVAEFEARTLVASGYGTASNQTAILAATAQIVGYLDTEMSTVVSGVADIQSRLPAALVGGRIDASIGAMAANVLTASALATDAVTEIQSGLSTLTEANVRTAVGLASANLDTQLAAIGGVTDKLDTTMEVDGLVYRFTTNALEQAPAGGGGGGGTDWTTDERTAIRSILGIPTSGTTPEDPTVGILDTIRDGIGATVNVYPLSAEDTQRENGTALAFAQRSTKSRRIRIFDSLQSPVDLSAKTLRFIVKDLRENIIMRVEDANLTVDGVDNSYVTIPISTAATRNTGTYRYALIDVNDGNNPLVEGDWVVYYSAVV